MAMTMAKLRKDMERTVDKTHGKRAFLILGPESSGCRFFTKILVNSGCVGSSVHRQPWDERDPTEDKIVWRRSVPHSNRWPDVEGMIDRLQNLGYKVMAFVTTREWHSMIKSQIKAPHVSDYAEGYAKLQKSYPIIFKALDKKKVPFIVVSFEAMLYQGHEYLRETLKLAQLDYKEVEIVDANKKHYLNN